MALFCGLGTLSMQAAATWTAHYIGSTVNGQVTISLSRGTNAVAVYLNVLTISSAGAVSVAPTITSGTPPLASLNYP